MPGQYNNMVWFYQESEENPEKATQEEEEDADAKVSIELVRHNTLKISLKKKKRDKKNVITRNVLLMLLMLLLLKM